MNKQTIIGVMGGGAASTAAHKIAYHLGQLIAGQGWVLLNGGRNCGIMQASAKGAFDAGGTTVGILPDETDEQLSPYIRIPVLTGIGSARNCINVLSSEVVVACQGGTGTVSEIALALKYGRPVILLDFDIGDVFRAYRQQGQLVMVNTAEEAVVQIKAFIENGGG